MTGNSVFKKIDMFGKRIQLRFQGESHFQTWCGVMATVVMIISLSYVFLKEGIHIYKGKITSLNYMLKSTSEADFAVNSISNHTQVFGFAFSDPIIDTTYVKYHLVLTKKGSHKEIATDWKPNLCTEEVISKLSQFSKSSIPENLNIMCYQIPRNIFKEGY